MSGVGEILYVGRDVEAELSVRGHRRSIRAAGRRGAALRYTTASGVRYEREGRRGVVAVCRRVGGWSAPRRPETGRIPYRAVVLLALLLARTIRWRLLRRRDPGNSRRRTDGGT